jgi:hypothetical protein
VVRVSGGTNAIDIEVTLTKEETGSNAEVEQEIGGHAILGLFGTFYIYPVKVKNRSFKIK